MADSIMGNTAICKKSFTYIPPIPPSKLIDSTNNKLNLSLYTLGSIDISRVAMYIINLMTLC